MESNNAQHDPNSNPRPPLREGTLYLVATPMGNLEDITLRACRTLKECTCIAAEDTRRTGLLLKHLNISKPMLSYHKFNEAKRVPELLDRLQQGQIIALVSDAGSPGISDPGERLVSAVIKAGLRVEPVPGPCALVAALSASGVSTSDFYFIGFLPQKKSGRNRELTRILALPTTLVLYESPYRILKLLEELKALAPSRVVVLARELTKKFEEWLRGQPEDLLTQIGERKLKGEFVVVIGKETDES